MQLEHILAAHGLIGRGGGKSKDEIPPPPITNFNATVVGNVIKLTYSIPVDSDFIGLLIIGKDESYPASISDGDVVLDKNIEDGGIILSEAIDDNITLGIRRYYRAFPYDWDRNYQTDTGQQISAIVKIEQTAPSAPTMASRTSTSIILNAIAGCEYRVGSGAWQDSTVFSGLNIATNYTFYARKKETSTHYASPVSSGATTQSAPSAPTVSNLEHDRATVTGVTGTEVRLGTGAWYDSPHTFTSLTEKTTYQAYARRKETSTHYASPVSSGATFTTDKGTQSAPSAPTVLEIEHDRATVNGGSGTEVRLGSGSWYDSPHVFTGLAEETSYTAYARRKETDTHYASPISSGKNFVTPTAIDPNSWAGIQSIVRRGLTSEYFSVGDQLMSNYNGEPIIWNIIGINHDTPTDSSRPYSMTIQTKDCLPDIQFDAPEPTNPDSNRKNYGNNRYIHSAVRQWLNSNESVFNWQSQHQYDAVPNKSLDFYNGAGFLRRLDSELASVIGLVSKRVARNTVADGGGQDSFTDKVFLLSRVEVGLGTEGDETGEFVYPFYDGIANAGRIKQLNGKNRVWWLRSPVVSSSYSTRYVRTSGALLNNNANNANEVSPACVIV